MQQRYRLTRSQDFVRLRQKGKAYRHHMMLLSLAPNQLDHNRYGFVTARNLGTAVKRNRVRRLLRESMRQLHPQLQPGYDVVIVARSHAVDQTFSMIQRTVEKLLRQAGLCEVKNVEDPGT